MVNRYFTTIKGFLLELGFDIRHEEAAANVLVVNKLDQGIRHLVLSCGEPLLILEQHLLDLPGPSCEVYQQLLQKNRDIIHGAFVLDESGRKVIFRDTLQLEHLDRPELEAVFNSLALLLSEFSDELIAFSKA
ncbi:YbjN domain-containing protein [Hymenobacter sp. 5516J-16]|uniref:YbjN domain-containing protein n=1 Tax=Hymenobacter sublimis TaxID=2933777 RepID=A0ABY4J5G5_9BACT|nr:MULTISPECIES: CesT family type III secretion system chaperone [Hymenobacter]UOQ77645.1 YbjN domain-containing protein [Hymenobacter sp. 5516J-16]UPL47626.1 YbjN domain-containing protein [Hymenobacter sublimis]